MNDATRALSMDVLYRTRRLIERGWDQEALARAASGKSTREGVIDAVAWLNGAFILASVGVVDRQVIQKAYAALCTAAETLLLAKWNDCPGHTKEEVLRVLDQAEAILRESAAEAIVDARAIADNFLLILAGKRPTKRRK